MTPPHTEGGKKLPIGTLKSPSEITSILLSSSNAEAAQKLGTPYHHISSLRTEYHAPAPPKGKKLHVMTLLEAFNNAEIARKVGLTRERVGQIRKEVTGGAKSRYHHQRTCTKGDDEQLHAAVLTLVAQNLDDPSIASQAGISLQALKKILSAHGIPTQRMRLRHSGPQDTQKKAKTKKPRVDRKKPSPESIQAAALHDQGYSRKQSARLLGISYGAICKRWRKLYGKSHAIREQKLTDQQTADLMRQGKSRTEIAETAGVSYTTATRHWKRICKNKAETQKARQKTRRETR